MTLFVDKPRKPETGCWARIPGYWRYLVSSNGEVLSTIWESPHPLSIHLGGQGYAVVCVTNSAGVRRCKALHRLVMLAFRGKRPPGMQCRHLDGDRMNPRLDNLAWGTPLENQHDREAHGTVLRGERHPNSKLNDRKVREIRRKGATDQRALAAKFGIDQTRISAIYLRKSWRHVK